MVVVYRLRSAYDLYNTICAAESTSVIDTVVAIAAERGGKVLTWIRGWLARFLRGLSIELHVPPYTERCPRQQTDYTTQV